MRSRRVNIVCRSRSSSASDLNPISGGILMLSRKITHATLALCVLGIAALGFIGCGNNPGGEVRLQGAGASFPNPLYQKWLSEYGKLNAHVKIDYQSIGSGGGIKQIQARTVDFGAS